MTTLMDSLLLTTWNVGGMRSPHRKYSIRGFLKQVKPHFLALQETHLEIEKVKFYVNFISSEYEVTSASSHGRSRGVALLYRRDFTLLQEAADEQGRYVWGKFRLEEQEFFVASIYAPNDTAERIQFWRRLRSELPQGRWLIAGDWNAVLTSTDSSSTSNVQTGEEALEFHALCNFLGAEDARERAEKRHGPKFTRAQARGGKLTWSRLDRIYVPDIRVRTVTHHGTFWASDHLPATAVLCWTDDQEKVQKPPPSAYFKADHYIVNQNLEHLRDVWNELEAKHKEGKAMDRFLKCWFGLRSEIKALQYQKKQQLLRLPEKERRLNDLLKTEVDEMTNDQERELAVLIQEVRELQAWNNHRWRITCREKFIKDGDVCSSYFFRRFQKRKTRTTVKKLKTNDVKNGFIVLIPKGLQPETVAQWRPITLLNVIYKVLAKLVASRLALILPQIIPPEQQGFLKGRSTFNCILTFCMVHKALKQNRKSALFLSIDQEKAYDRLLPQFLWQVMSKLGFFDKFISAVKALQEDAESSLLFNGRALPPFRIGKGVRQGCPMSPLLFVIATCPLIAALKSEIAKGGIKPIVLEEGVVVSCMALADDFAFFTQVHKQDVHNLMELLKQVEVASGARVNLSKSKILLIGWKKQFPVWARNLGFTLVSSKEVTNYLGAPLTTIRRGTAKGGALIIKTQAKVKYFSSLFLSFESRLLVAKHALFPTLMYQLFTTAFNKTTLKKLQGIIREYIWAGDKEGKCSIALTAWENFTLPKDLGGMGLYDILLFQQALICRTLLSALADPQGSLWAPILARTFLRTDETNLVATLSRFTLSSPIRFCPVTSLILTSWHNLLSSLNWRQEFHNNSLRPFSLEDWTTDDGTKLGTHWRMSTIYRVLARDRASKQVQVMNDKWRLTWNPQQWSTVWGITEFKLLSNKHRSFLWRAFMGAFMDGKRARTFGFSDFQCSFCGAGAEDFTHSVWLCPRWAQLWREIPNNFDGCLQLLDLRNGLELVPEVLFWAQQGSKRLRLFKLWMLAVVWRKLWSERCILRFQNRRNTVTVQLIAVNMLEEIWARRHKIGKKTSRHFASILLTVAPNVSNRYKELLKEE
ncbi:hypothetical protein R1sor_013501 [Riccia sorocarpa]|uniref:Reverse transcriptase domain-containing protein n=1 Tax=Riccia sorocarpa TaxID=122646 RepID=A0ABD3H9P5_9MARC